MRFIIFGAGAIGGVVGGRLFQHGYDVVLIARGAHGEVIRDRGLRVESPDESVTLPVPVVDHPGKLSFGAGDIVILTMKTQDTLAALGSLAAAAPTDIPVVCAQNGVANESIALRVFPRVYGVSVMCPAAFLEPGKVQAYASPVTGVLDVGRYPSGDDDIAASIATGFRASTFESEVRADIQRRKWGKLLFNLSNAIEAVCGPDARHGPIDDLVRREGEACLRAAGIDFLLDKDPRGDLIKPRAIASARRPGGSSWQSLRRGAGTIETDYLNGEIVQLGRLYGVSTPVNELLQQHANRMAREHHPPGTVPEEELVSVASPGYPAEL